MAHIADFMVGANSSVGLNNYIARELSPQPQPHPSQDVSFQITPQATPKGTPTEEKEKFVWRMHQPAEPRKYQLFPAKDKLSITAGRKSPDVEKDGQQNGSLEKVTLPALRLKPKEQTLVRRRKVSVPELGPMTTVQEVAMDSPTIPGRPPLHERSISAPGNSWRQHVFGESMLSCMTGPPLDENAEILAIMEANSPATDDGQQSPKAEASSQPQQPQQPLSPKSLAPLVIPSSSMTHPKLTKKSSNGKISGTQTAPDVPPKSARMLDSSPRPRGSPYTLHTPQSASTLSHSTAPTSASMTPLSAVPISAPGGRSSPKPWTAMPIANSTSRARGQSEVTTRAGPQLGHRRGESEASIMDRGRPKKRPMDGSPIKRKASVVTREVTEERKAFEALPQGMKANEVKATMADSEIEALRKQAFGQACRFEVLSSKDVEALSRELRGLDERCEYLRKTHRSLRAGRRNLHDRICSYLRSPRVARFSHESILKQEEALSELDSSIDDWVSKLELAENRRTRVRQKLLEHVAGALILPQARPSHEGMTDTPPRSPTKSQSPQRLAEPVHVTSPEPSARRDVESIRIYADSDISALLKDVEEEITRMGEEASSHRVEDDRTAAVATPPVLAPAFEEGITLTAMTYSAKPPVVR